MKTNSWTTAGQAKDKSSSPNLLVKVLRRGRHWVWGPNRRRASKEWSITINNDWVDTYVACLLFNIRFDGSFRESIWNIAVVKVMKNSGWFSNDIWKILVVLVMKNTASFSDDIWKKLAVSMMKYGKKTGWFSDDIWKLQKKSKSKRLTPYGTDTVLKRKLCFGSQCIPCRLLMLITFIAVGFRHFIRG